MEANLYKYIINSYLKDSNNISITLVRLMILDILSSQRNYNLSIINLSANTVKLINLFIDRDNSRASVYIYLSISITVLYCISGRGIFVLDSLLLIHVYV